MDKIKTYTTLLLEELRKNELVSRALHTFWQGALAVLIVGYDQILDLAFKGDLRGAFVAFLALLVGALAAGASSARVIIKSAALAYLATKRQ